MGVSVSINDGGMQALFRSRGVADKLGDVAGEVAVVARALQGELRAEVTVEHVTMAELGIHGAGDRPAAAVVATGHAWRDHRGEQWVAGTPDSFKAAVQHFAGGE